MAGRKLTLEDFPLKTEGTDRCWIVGCEEGRVAHGLCKKHYNSSRTAGVWNVLVAQIGARSEAPMPGGEIAVCGPIVLGSGRGGEGHAEGTGPHIFRPATDPLMRRIQEVEAELRALKDALAEAVGAHPEPLNALQQVALLKKRVSRAEQGGELTDALGSVRRLADELTAVDQALGPYRLADVQGNRICAIEALTAPSGPVPLSEVNLRERYDRLNEIGHAESLLEGLSEPLQKALRVVLEAEKAKVLRVCP